MATHSNKENIMRNLTLATIGFIIGLLGTMAVLPFNVTKQSIYIDVVPVLTLKEEDGILYSNDYLLRYTQNDIGCMTANIFHEARNQTTEGQMLVGQVVLNRQQKPKRFSNTICGVITAGKYKNGKIVKNKCAFSWYCDGVSDRPDLTNIKEFNAWTKAEYIAKSMLRGVIRMNTKATHYHTTNSKPYWRLSATMTYINTVGAHKTYIEKT